MNILKGSKKVLLGIGLASCGAAALAIIGKADDSISVKASTFYDNYINSRYFYEPQVINKWDYNWDKRQPENILKSLKGSFKPEEEKEEYNDKLKKAKTTACRHLILIRHGQYFLNGNTDEERTLTELGREQAAVAAKRLKELNLPYTKIFQSTMQRATETASIISKEFPKVPVTSCDLLREGFPVAPEPPTSRIVDEKIFKDGPRIEAAFRRYFHRASPSQKQDSYEIIVCHANVIRYFICRALQLAPEAWLRFGLHNCSLTWIAILPSGRVRVYTVGDVGFMPASKLTVT